MAGIGDLIVNLGTNNAGWNRGLSAASKSASSFASGLKSAMVPAAAAIGGLWAAQRGIASLAKSQGGAWAELDKSINDVGGALLEVVQPLITVAAEGLRTAVDWGLTFTDTLKGVAVEVAVFVSHFGDLLMLGAMQWQLWGVELLEDAKHTFTVAIPAYLEWFTDNFANMLTTAGDFAGTVFANLTFNIENAWQALMDYFAGNPVEFDWTPLTEGFQNTVEKLPDIPKRMTTDFENSLRKDIDAFSAQVADSMQEQREKFSHEALPPVLAPTASGAPAVGDDGTAAKGKAVENKLAGAMLKGSADAYSTLVQAQVRGKDPTAKATEEQVKLTKEKVVPALQAMAGKMAAQTVVTSFGFP